MLPVIVVTSVVCVGVSLVRRIASLVLNLMTIAVRAGCFANSTSIGGCEDVLLFCIPSTVSRSWVRIINRECR